MTQILWRQIQKNNFHCWKKLANHLLLSDAQKEHIYLSKQFPLNLPLRLAEKIQKSKLNDPILQQFLPTLKEKITASHFNIDPLKEQNFKLSDKLLKKYLGRALLVCTSACAMHCRYCFRQHFEYTSSKDFSKELKLIEEDTSLEEILLSGGDPLSLGNKQLSHIFSALNSQSHIRRIRIHTRFPIGIPERIDEDLLDIFQNCKKQIYFVIHCNHAQELDEDIFNYLGKIKSLGIPVLNQSVLLKNINDNLATLANLFLTLANQGILPYYLHQLDPVEGASHFEVSVEYGKKLMRKLSEILPGYALPRYVKEIPGKNSKTLIT